MPGEPGVSGEELPAAATRPAGGPAPGASPAPVSPRRRWLRRALLAVAGIVAVVGAAASWVALDPGLIRPLAERLASTASGRQVVIGELEFGMTGGRVVVEARDVRVGLTTTERVRFSLGGSRAHASGAGVLFPNGSYVDQFRATIELSLAGRPRIATVDAIGAVLVTARRPPTGSGPAGAPPFARLLVVPRILLGLGLERLVLHNGTLEYRGLSSEHTAGVSAILETTGHGLAVRGELAIAPHLPPVPFTGAVRAPMSDDWQIDLQLSGDGVPMESVRFLAGVIEPGPTVRTTLARLSSTAWFTLSVRLAQSRIEHATLDFTFAPPGGSADDGVDLDGIRIVTRATPDPAGWAVTGEIDWTRLPGGAKTEPSPFVLRWTAGVPGSLRWSARRLSIPLLSELAADNLPPDDPLRPVLERLQPVGTIDELAASGDPGAGGDAGFRMNAALSGVAATGGEWKVSGAGARVELAGGEWRVRFAGDRASVAIPSFRSLPYDLALQGEVRIVAGDPGWELHARGLEVSVSGIAGRIDGTLDSPLPGVSGAAELDAEIRLNDLALADAVALLPDRRGPAFSRWYRRAVRAGRLTGASLRIQGDPRRIPFPDGDGTFEARGTIRDGELAYARAWPTVRIEEAGVRAIGKTLEFTDIRGSIFDTSIESGLARLPDMTDSEGRVRVSLSGAGPASDLLAFVRASPLAGSPDGPATVVHADGPASTAIELDVPYGRTVQGRRFDASGRIELDGVAFSLVGHRAVLEDVRGELAFDAEHLSGGPLHGRFHGAAIESRLAFNRLDGIELHFSGEGDGEWFGRALDDLVNLGVEVTGPWLEHATGRISWDATYYSHAGVVFRSDLGMAAIDLPPPFEKAAGTIRPLDITLTPGDREWLVEAGYGAVSRGLFEIAETDDGWTLARGEITLGGARPSLPVEGHVEVAGELSFLDLDPWLTLAAAGAEDTTGWLSRIGRISVETDGARAFDRRIGLRRFDLLRAENGSGFEVHLAGEGVAGAIRVPADRASGEARIHLERLHFGESFESGEDGEGDPQDEAEKDTDVRPELWPSFEARIDSLRFEAVDLGEVTATGVRTDSGLELRDLQVNAPDLRITGHGSWLNAEDGTPVSRLEARLESEDFSRLLSATGLTDTTAAGGAARARVDLAWPGSPLDPSLERTEGAIAMVAENGHLPRVRVGPIGRTLALLSLDALPRVLALDLSHVVGRGFVFDRITARTQLEDGMARIRELAITGPSARVEVSGNVDLAARRYDQEVAVIPRVTRSGALLPAWTAVWPVLVGNFLLEKVTGDEIFLDRLFRLRYRLTGPWDDPVVERIAVDHSPADR